MPGCYTDIIDSLSCTIIDDQTLQFTINPFRTKRDRKITTLVGFIDVMMTSEVVYHMLITDTYHHTTHHSLLSLSFIPSSIVKC